MRHFKLALIVTAIAIVVCIAVGIAGVTWITRDSGANSDQRARMLGQATGMLTVFVVGPFWIYGAYQFGKERRESQKKSRPKAKTLSPRRKPTS